MPFPSKRMAQRAAAGQAGHLSFFMNFSQTECVLSAALPLSTGEGVG
jgi:hypothetical protein